MAQDQDSHPPHIRQSFRPPQPRPPLQFLFILPPLPPADVAIHSGDLTSTGKIHEHERALQLLHSLPAPLKIVIPGNHDLTLDFQYCTNHTILHGRQAPHDPEAMLSEITSAKKLYTSNSATEAGIVYLEKGHRTFVLPNGAKLTVYVSAYTPKFCDWAFAYPRDPNIDPFNASSPGISDAPVTAYDENDFHDENPSNQTMIMITHGPPRGILDTTTRGENVGCDHLLKAVSRCRPILHCFGHIHEGWGSARRTWSWNRSSSEIEELEEALRREEALAAEGGYIGGKRETYEAGHARIKEAIGKARRTLEGKIRYADDTAPPESQGNLTPLTTEQKEAVGYIDATGIKHGLETVFTNASIMSVNYVPDQKPWVVDLLLPAASEDDARNPRLVIHGTRELD